MWLSMVRKQTSIMSNVCQPCGSRYVPFEIGAGVKPVGTHQSLKCSVVVEKPVMS